ncbi:MAG: hypothetical protein U5K32_02350 [Bacteroidales bacterium]|nr:hypothetical protein [Bacteroidales bacterium]
MPEEIIPGSDTIFNIYAAKGEKLSNRVSYNGSSGIEKDYVGNFVYSGSNLDFILTSEGIISADVSGNYNYGYFIKDHPGNIRVSFWDSSGVATVNQETSYCPFGMIMHQWDYASSNEFLYNGKEFQDELLLDWYDYGDSLFELRDSL